MIKLGDWSERALITIGEIDEENLWLDRLRDVVENDPTATQNWYIPLQLLDFVGFDVEEIQEWARHTRRSGDENRNEQINESVVWWIDGRIAYNNQRMERIRSTGKDTDWDRNMSYDADPEMRERYADEYDRKRQ